MEKTVLDSVAEVLELAARAEVCVRNFYQACASRWPNDAEFWTDLAAEEDGHYKMVLRMLSLVNANPGDYVMRGVYATEYYRSFLDWVRSNTEEVVRGSMEDVQAVGVANTIENTILENRLQDLAETTDREYHRLLSQIIEQTKRHNIMVTARAKGHTKARAAQRPGAQAA